MNRHYFLILSLFFSMQMFAQTGIGTISPDASAKLDVSSTNKGFLPPRVSLTSVTDNTTIPSPATGLFVYCKGDAGLAAGYYYWNGNAWATIATAGGSGSFASSFMRGSRIATQSIAVNGVVVFSNIDNSSGGDISLNTSTGKITLAPGNTYRLRAAVPNFSSGQRPAFIWYNETTSANVGSATFAYNPGDAATLGAFGAPAELIITPTVSTVVSFRLLSSLSSGNVTLGGNGDFSTTGSYPWFDIEVISGNAPVTGQSVDYGIARYTGADVAGLAAGALVSFDATAAGNLSWSANKFTLKANKTYEIESSLAIYNTSVGTAGRFQIYDYTNAISLANSLFMSQNGTGSNSQSANTPMKCIVTPASDIQVGIRLLDYFGGAPGIVGNAVLSGSNSASNSTYFVVKQIGSSAIINPWTLSGTNTYNNTGNVGIGNTSPSTTLTLGNSTGTIGGEILLNPTSTQYEGGQIVFKRSLVGSTVDWTLDQYGTSSSNARFRIFNGSSETNGIAILENGYLGIGTATPSNKLHVQSSDGTTVYIESTTADNNGMMILNANTNQNWSSNWHEFIYFRNQGNNIGGIIGSNGGNMVSYTTSSDYRLKTDLKGFNGLDLVNKIKTYDYAWKRDSSRMYGFMAHELQEVLPYVVTGRKDAIDANGKIIPQSVDYSKLTPILVKAIQEQDTKIKEQQKQIDKLIKRIELLEIKK